MSEVPRWRRYARFWGADPRADVEDEFAFHVRERVEELIAQGMDPAEAREEAFRGFGDIDRVKAVCLGLARERRSAMHRREQLRVLWQDAVFAVRQMRSQPLLTAAVLLTLAVGIGATTSIFSVVNAVVLRPLPYTGADRLVNVWETFREWPRGSASFPHFRDWTEQSRSFQATAAWWGHSFNLTGDGDPQRVVGAAVTPGWFDVVHMPPAAGRYFRPGEDAAGTHVVVLSYELWRSRFGGDPAILGRDIDLNGEPYTVVGVTPAGYRLTDSDEELWTVLQWPPDARENYYDHSLRVVGLLKPGVTREMAQADLERVTEGIRQRVPEAMHDRGVNVTEYATTLTGDYRTQLLVLLGAVLFVLLLACGNVASLLLARATARRKELAIRAALGGGRGRLVRQLLTESVVLATTGGLLGILIAWLGVRTLVAAAPQGIPRIQETGVDATVLLFALAATLTSGLLFGLAPALRATRTDLQPVLREGGKTSRTSARDRLRSMLVVGEIAVALVLVVGAGLFVRSAQLVQRVPLGFRAEGVTMARVTLPADRYGDPGVISATYGRLLEELRAQPGVASAGFGTRAPLWGFSIEIFLTLRDFPREPGQAQLTHARLISDGYFETLDIPLRQGRLFEPADMGEGAPPVVIMNETLARQSFGDANPIGQLVTGWDNEGEQIWREVVGVVADFRSFGRESDTPPEVYYPYSRGPAPSWRAHQNTASLVARPRGGADVISALRAAVARVDPALPLYDVRRLSDVVDLNFAGRRFGMLLLSLLGITGLMLAVVGIYGVVGFFVMQRRQEIGVRMALGATAGDVLRLVLLHGARLTLLGVLIGAVAALGVTGVLRSLLFEIDARDPVTFLGGAVVLTVAAIVAALVPAWRAMRVEPLRTLGAE